ncbi:peptidase S9 [Coraliomargarita sinensis]|uniref:Peptidase S9 n=1 Tax=Coraliomargarita sinensis TaxID=2174842 RepID=A0A317ZL61_9BACT|nr:alpha/beta hydrolase [Coraliomargarita sinensis]PXA04688.1 peptidase S9 [Coraliomargarita sinensis]
MKRILLYLSLISPILSSHALETEGFQPDESFVYKTVGETKLKLHVFYPENHNPSGQRPAIVFFFGGGWVSGSPSQFYPHCEYLASRGMVAMSAEYRVRSRHQTTPQECVKDGKSAVRWIKQHADKLGVDPERVLAGGGSAGGHVAAATGTVEGFEEEGEELAVSSRPEALLLFNPVYDNGPNGCGHERVKDYWEAISPMHNISEGTPPTLVFFGTRDKLVPVATAKAYQERMEALGLRSDLHLYQDEPHGFFNHGRKYHDDTIQKMDQFLVSLDYLEPQPYAKSN